MTHRISAGSPVLVYAQRFGTELTRAMAARQVGQNVVKVAAGVSRASIVEFRNGRNLPTMPVAQRLAESLRWPRLEEIVREARTRTCTVCGRTFMQDVGRPKLYCTVTCRVIANQLGSMTGASDGVMALRGELLRIGPARKQVIGRAITMIEDARRPEIAAVAGLQLHQIAVDAMCRGCEPEGYCRTPECPLRDISPLPLTLDLRRDVEMAVKPPGPHSPAANAKRAAAHSLAWATDEGRRTRQSERMNARYAAETPEQKAARIQRIVEGKRRARAVA